MNERIKELAEQAQQYAEYVTPQGLECFDMFKEKFAELIVRECAETVQDFVDHRFPASEYPVRLRRYFGVEE
jgi:hypothetical protein